MDLKPRKHDGASHAEASPVPAELRSALFESSIQHGNDSRIVDAKPSWRRNLTWCHQCEWVRVLSVTAVIAGTKRSTQQAMIMHAIEMPLVCT